MNDALLVALWAALAAAAFAGVIAARRAGVAVTYLRDAIHVGAGLWPLGWPLWHGAAAPIALALAVAAGTCAIPALARRGGAAARIRQSVSDGDERWSGLQLYAASFTAGTVLAFATSFAAPAAALLALALGDGLGGAIGRRFGRHFYAAPGGKRKSVEGSAAVAVLCMTAVALAGSRFGVTASPGAMAGAGLFGALAEALAPAGTDNLLLPAAVWLFLFLQGGVP
jgi:dolichol kinase